MHVIKLVGFYLGNVLAISIPLALFEIYLERFKSGWNGEFYSPFWGRKFHIGWINKVMEKTYVSMYHLVMWVGVMPGVLITEYFLLAHLNGGHGWIVSCYKIRLVPILYLPAIWMGVSVVEDFLWFALNWHFPGALQMLVRAEMVWHTDYVSITRTIKLPRFYLMTWVWVALVLGIQYLIAKFASK
ncbi:MAG: hypothetical protein V4481_00435 [Patescibacteria group bacterium]